MIERYIYAVIRQLPEKSRADVRHELTTLIEAKMEAMSDTLPEREKVDRVLRELGDPKKLATRYRGKERYLIGPRYFDYYLFVLKAVVFAVFIGISIASSIGALFSDADFVEMATGYLATLFSACLQGAAWVTGIFALFEYKDITFESEREEAWDPSQMPPLPHEKAKISRGESIFSIILTTIFLPVVFFFPEIVGVYYRTGSSWAFTPLFNVDALSPFRMMILVVFTLNILIELIKLIKGRWTKRVAVLVTALNFLSSGLFIAVIYNLTIWNNNIIQTFERYLPVSFERMLLLIIVTVVFVTIGESVSALYKGFKYGEE